LDYGYTQAGYFRLGFEGVFVMKQQQRPKMSTKEIERRLGLQYAQVLKENASTASVYRDCEEVIQGALTLLDHYNRVAVAMKSKTTGKKLAGMFT